jgi:recombinational DNA repair protein (RecF pathway)
MPGQPLTTDAFVLLKRPPADTFQTLTLFSPTHGLLTALLRLPKKSTAATILALDLFDEASLYLETANQGQTWFIKETRLLVRHAGLGRDYETLRHTSALATYLTRNPVPEESRPRIYALLREALAAFAGTARPDIVYFKTLYRLGRDEGHPLKQHWFPRLPAADQPLVATLLNQPVAAQSADAATVARLQKHLDDYLREHTEILP